MYIDSQLTWLATHMFESSPKRQMNRFKRFYIIILEDHKTIMVRAIQLMFLFLFLASYLMDIYFNVMKERRKEKKMSISALTLGPLNLPNSTYQNIN